MSLLNRYIHEVGRFLPRKNRADIQAELRSSIVDTLEDRYGAEPADLEVQELLQEIGPPRQVAASYHPGGQYLIGPSLFPLFRMVATIAIAAVLGAQLLAWSIAIFVAGESFHGLEMIASLFNSIPSALGWVVLVFLMLQYFDAQPELDETPWEPNNLPQIDPDEDLKRGELIVGLVFGVLFLVLVSAFPQWVGFVTLPEGKFYPNPVIIKYLPWIQVSLASGIGFNIYLLWKGRKDWITRLLGIALNIYQVVVLSFLVTGHNAWLEARSAGGFLEAIEAIPSMVNEGGELVAMHAFRLAFMIALIVTVIEIIANLYRLVKSSLNSDFSPQDFVPKAD